VSVVTLGDPVREIVGVFHNGEVSELGVGEAMKEERVSPTNKTRSANLVSTQKYPDRGF